MIAGALGLAQGDAATAIQAARAGKMAGDNVGAHLSERDKERQIKANEKIFERAFDEFQIANPGVDMVKTVEQILSAKPGEKIPENMQVFAANVYGLKNTFDFAGYGENSKQAVINMAKDLKKYQ